MRNVWCLAKGRWFRVQNHRRPTPKVLLLWPNWTTIYCLPRRELRISLNVLGRVKIRLSLSTLSAGLEIWFSCWWNVFALWITKENNSNRWWKQLPRRHRFRHKLLEPTLVSHSHEPLHFPISFNQIIHLCPFRIREIGQTPLRSRRYSPTDQRSTNSFADD